MRTDEINKNEKIAERIQTEKNKSVLKPSRGVRRKLRVYHFGMDQLRADAIRL